MPNKTQAKAAIDTASTAIKADIDNILPVGVDIRDGAINFGPVRYKILLNAGGVVATMNSWSTSIQTALTSAGRTFIVDLRRRADESREIEIRGTGGNQLTVLIQLS